MINIVANKVDNQTLPLWVWIAGCATISNTFIRDDGKALAITSRNHYLVLVHEWPNPALATPTLVQPNHVGGQWRPCQLDITIRG